jgi:predicted nucleic acid-binding protein
MFVTDTHPLAYYAGRKTSKLSRRAVHLFEEAGNAKTVIFVPTPVLWEIADLTKAGRIGLPTRIFLSTIRSTA